MSNKQYWLLGRSCSAYTEPDLILGIFDKEDLAEKAKEQYKTVINQELQFDFHQFQGYQKVNLEKDLYVCKLNPDIISIQEINNNNNNNYSNDHLFLLLATCDGFGQIIQGIKFITNNMQKLISKAQIYDEEEKDEEYIAYFLYDFVKLNKLRFENVEINVCWLNKTTETFTQQWSLNYYKHLKQKLSEWINEYKEIEEYKLIPQTNASANEDGKRNHKREYMNERMMVWDNRIRLFPFINMEILYSSIQKKIKNNNNNCINIKPFSEILLNVIKEITDTIQ